MNILKTIHQKSERETGVKVPNINNLNGEVTYYIEIMLE